MFNRQSPRKRRQSEYCDPDYYHSKELSCVADDKENPICNPNKRPKTSPSLAEPSSERENDYLQKVRDILGNEFDKELAFKQNQLEDIDNRLLKARRILDKLRYAVVASFYKKQELSVPRSFTGGGTQTIFKVEDKGAQTQIHPSLKKLIGKKPKQLSDVIRSCPKRTAAKNAVETIRAKSEIQKREERKLKQIIKGQGIVIDHSIQKDVDISSLLNAARKSSLSKINKEKSDIKATTCMSGKPLITSRLNNKIKHMVVVGNTSKFIGSDQEIDAKNKHQIFTHKWLIYVQSKESTIPIERYIKKVRFYLHHSYRPNDVVDIDSPPFHIVRRGWGEFPIRVQLHFHQEYHQKPVQLFHTVILDKTRSGIQTLGAETLLEVWLRNVNPKITLNEIANISKRESDLVQQIEEKIPCAEELVDDNLLDFLNRIEATQSSISADIEKIHATILPSEVMSLKTQITYKNLFSNTPLMMPAEKAERANLATTSAGALVKKEVICETFTSKPQTTYVKIPQNTTNLNCTIKKISSQTVPSQETAIHPRSSTIHNNEKMLKTSLAESRVNKAVLPIYTNVKVITKPSMQATVANKQITVSNSAPKQILQKKLVQLVDATGKVKYMQMLVATTPTTSLSKDTVNEPKPITSTNSFVSNISGATQTYKSTQTTIKQFTKATDCADIHAVSKIKPNIFKQVSENMQTKPQIATFSTLTMTAATTTISCSSAITNSNSAVSMPKKLRAKPVQNSSGSTMKKIVFHKEGKVYIIDPLQNKIKQQQKKQQSLLKPQISLLKQQMQQQNHNLPTSRISESLDHDYAPAPKVSPQIHFGLKQQRLNTINALQLNQMKRMIFEKQFLRQEFKCMQNAVEFALRRLKLVASKNSLVSAFPFVCHSESEFQSLTAFKQRSYEWLRAKHIARLMCNHKVLQRVNNSNHETFWSTKEIAIFAREHAYILNIKSLPRLERKFEENHNEFTDIVKVELKQKENTPYETLTHNRPILKWINNVFPILAKHQFHEDQNQIIDVDTLDDISKDKGNRQRNRFFGQLPSHPNSFLKQMCLSTPPCLQNEFNLVTNICKLLSIKFEPEEIISEVWHPSSLTVLAHCINIFLQKIVRGALSQRNRMYDISSESVSIIQTSDIAKVFSRSVEYDFLTNNYLGSNINNEGISSTVKQEHQN